MNADFSTSSPGDVGHNMIMPVLARLLADRELKVSERNRRFLSFVVSETLAGREDRIKAYSIGVDVFGRPDDFDPGSDPIVRIEAARLRTALLAYYQGPGSGESLRILLPPGGYVPAFQSAGALNSMAALQAENSAQPELAGYEEPDAHAIAIIIVHRTDPHDKCAAVRGQLVIDSIVYRLTRFGYGVFVKPTSERRAAARAIKDLLVRPDLTYALDMTVSSIAVGKRFSWSMIDARSGQVGAADFLDSADDGLPSAQMIDEIAECAVATVTAAVSRRRL